MLEAKSGDRKVTDRRTQRILFIVREFSTLKLAHKTTHPFRLNELYKDLNIIYHLDEKNLTNIDPQPYI